jgi:malate dehydrogenase
MAGSRKTTDAKFKVCVVGGAGGIGQPLSLAVASHALVKELSIVDLDISAVPVDGVAADLGHVEGPTKVTSTVLNLGIDKAIDKAGDALTGCNVVLVPAGMPRKPGQDRKDLMNVNADIAKGTLEACAKYCPDAVVGLIVNPVNSIVPAMAELYKKAGLDPLKIVGITTLDCVRSNKFVQEITGEPSDVPVIGGHAGKTILALLSQDPVASKIPAADIPALDERIQNAGTEVVQAKAGKGSATLSMAFAAARFMDAVLEGMAGNPQTECGYVQSSAVPELPYFASKIVFGESGVKEVLPIGDLNEFEKTRLAELIPILKEEIDMGLEYAASNEFAK